MLNAFRYSFLSTTMEHLQIWFDYQALWDLQADFLFGKLGSDTTKWMKALEDIKYVYLSVYLYI